MEAAASVGACAGLAVCDRRWLSLSVCSWACGRTVLLVLEPTCHPCLHTVPPPASASILCCCQCRCRLPWPSCLVACTARSKPSRSPAPNSPKRLPTTAASERHRGCPIELTTASATPSPAVHRFAAAAASTGAARRQVRPLREAHDNRTGAAHDNENHSSACNSSVSHSLDHRCAHFL